MKAMHSLLRRQLKRHFGESFVIPDKWRAFVGAVSEAYQEFDGDREMLERSLDLSSQELLQANSEMRAVFEAIPDLVFRLDQQGTILDIKAGATGDLLMDRQSLLGRRIQDTPVKHIGEQFSEALKQVIQKKSVVNIEYSAILQEQESFYEARLMPLPDRQIIVIIRNITERKQSLRLLGSAVEQATESIMITDAELDLPGPRILFVNPAFTRMTGYTAAEVLGKTPRILQGWRTDRAVLDRLRKELSAGKTFEGETVNCRKDGTEFHVEWRVAPIRNSSGAITHFLGLQRDVTERKAAEETLRKSEDLFHTLAKVSPTGIFRTDANGHTDYWNEKMCQMTGMTMEEALGTGWAQAVHPEDRQPVFDEWARTVSERRPFKMQFRFRHRDGSVIWIMGESQAIVDSEGRVTGFVGTITDITDLKQAQETAAREQARLQFLFDSLPIGVCLNQTLCDGSQIRLINDAHLHIAGISREQDTPETWRHITHPDDRERREEFSRQIKAGKINQFSMEKRYIRPDGRMVWTLFSKQRRKFDDGSYDDLTTVVDVTGLKQAQESADQERARLQFIFDSLPIGICLNQVRPDGSETRMINDAHLRIAGITREQDTPESWRRISHPDDRSRQDLLYAQFNAGKFKHFVLDKRYVQPGGQIVWVLFSFQRREFDDGTFEDLTTVVDITERKRMEAALTYERDLLRTLLDLSPDLIYFKDTQSRFIKVSKGHAQCFGVATPEDLVGKTDFDFFSEAHARPAFEDEQEIIRTGRPVIGKVEKEIWRDGRETWCLSTKIPFRNQAGTIIGTFGISKDITAIKQAETALQLSEERSRSIIEGAYEAFVSIDTEGRICDWNRRAEAMFGWPRAEVMGRFLHEVVIPPGHRDDHLRGMKHLEATGEGPMLNKRIELTALRRNGEEFPVELTIWPLRLGDQTSYNAFLSDITERKQIEARLFQSQKMETVGRLAGGVAHEFNSILTAIIGRSELLQEDLPVGSEPAESAAEIGKAAGRAADLTRQLLAYGRKQLLQPEILDLNQVVADMDEVLRHLMGGETMGVNLVFAPGRHEVKVDAGQMEQVIINLAMNARDAMPNGGSLTLETASVSFDQESVGHYAELKPGGYVLLAISDTGKGMSESVKSRAFEPFFTTKGVGQGAGLGLSTCYGIIKQSGGHISVYSEAGRGTTFKIYLPQVQAPAQVPVRPLDSPDLPRGTETILLVEDDPALRDMAATLLRRLGYKVLAAANGVEAMSLSHERETGHIDLLFTDVVMPDMSGKELADRVRVMDPHTRILFTSAYTENAIVHQGALDKGVLLIQKPFTPSALARKVREVLDAPHGQKPDGAPNIA